MSHSTLNSAEKSHQKASKHRARGLTRDTRATVEQVLDPRTMRILQKMKNRSVFDQFFACVSTGKEANVYQACRTEENFPIAVKVFKTSILVFKDRSKYVDGEYRFRHGYAGNNPRKMVSQWAEKEARNLRRISAVGIRCPRPIELRQHVLAMSFVGTMEKAAPKLRDAALNQAMLRKAYIETVGILRQMVQECKLVHGDFSEFNLLHYDGHVFVIDVSQSVEFDHPMALDFLKRDCINVTRYFEKAIVHDTPEHFDSNYHLDSISAELEFDEELKDCRMNWRPMKPKELYDFCLTPSKGQTAAVRTSINANIVGHAELELPEPEGNWDVYMPSVDTLVVLGEDDEARMNKKRKHQKNRRNNLLVQDDHADSDSSDEVDDKRHTSAGQAVGVALDMETALRGAEQMSRLCGQIQRYMEDYAVKRYKMTEEQLDKDDESEMIFLETWKPTSLQEIGDLSILDAELERRLGGEEERFLSHLMKKQKLDDEIDEAEEDDSEGNSTDEDEDDEDEDDEDDEDDDEDEDDEDEDEDDEDDDEDSKSLKRRKKKEAAFDGNIPLGMTRKEWQKKVKEENKEKRKNKIPKHLKKRFRKKASGRK